MESMTDKKLREVAHEYATKLGPVKSYFYLPRKRGFLAGAEYARAEVLKTLREPATIEFHNDGNGWADWLEKQWKRSEQR